MKQRRGFALMLVLALVALSLVVALSLLALSKVNTATARTSEHQTQARQNALAGLQVALERLQSLAGPDQRATAEADLVTGRVAEKAHWTGVWDNTGAVRGWLVSGDANSVTTALTAGANRRVVRLVGSNSAGSSANAHVSVETEPILGSSAASDPTLPQGSFAYWIGDEGVKATVNFSETLDVADAGRQRQMIAARPRAEELASALDPAATATTRAKLQKVQTFQQIRQVGSLTLADNFHDLTPLSLGVLSNPVAGGLKIDLSAPGAAQQLGENALAAWLSVRPTIVDSQNRATYAVGTPAAGVTIAPVITEFLVKFAFYRDGASTATTGTLDFRVHCQVQIEMWNPYTSSLSAARSMRIRMSGLPTQLVFTTGAGAVFTANLQQAIDGMNFSIPAGTSFAAGSVTTFYGGGASGWLNDSSPAQDGQFASLGFSIPSAGAALRNFTLSAPSGTGNTTLQVALEYDGSEIRRVTPSFAYAAPVVSSSVTWGSNTASGRTNWLFGYGFAVRDSVSQWADGALQSGTDPRVSSPTAIATETVSTPWRTIPTANVGSIALTGSATNGTSFFGSTSVSTTSRYMLWELPRQEVISLGTIQHQQQSMRPNAFGNPWGGAANGLFDSVFMSALPRTNAGWTAPPLPAGPNSFLHLYSGTTPATRTRLLDANTAAEHLLVRGAFNVNSTSSRAWRAVLSGAHLPGSYFLSSITTETKHAFFRHAHSAQESSTSVGKPTGSSTPWRQGVRNLNDSDHVASLATAVAAQIRARGRPFVSLTDFLSSSVLHSSLDPTQSFAGSLTPAQESSRVSINDNLLSGMPSYLSQADVVTMIAPFIMARSDTFRIRVYGDAVDPSDGTVRATAYCEAVVQRTPELLDATRGRKFVLIYFRWLTTADI